MAGEVVEKRLELVGVVRNVGGSLGCGEDDGAAVAPVDLVDDLHSRLPFQVAAIGIDVARSIDPGTRGRIERAWGDLDRHVFSVGLLRRNVGSVQHDGVSDGARFLEVDWTAELCA